MRRVLGDSNQGSSPAFSMGQRFVDVKSKGTATPGPDYYDVGTGDLLLSTTKSMPALSMGTKLKTWKEIEVACGCVRVRVGLRHGASGSPPTCHVTGILSDQRLAATCKCRAS